MIKGYKMSVEPEEMSGKYYDMSARDAKGETGQYFKMSADGGEETGRIKHAERKDTMNAKG